MKKDVHQRYVVRRLRTKRLAVCAMFSALGVIIVWTGALIDVLDITTAALASMLLIPVTVEYGKIYPYLVWAVTGFLALILLPQKMPAIVYLIFGYYPTLKFTLEKFSKVLALLCKELVFIIAEIAVIWASNMIIGVEDMPAWYYAILYGCGFLALNLFDVALTKLIKMYHFRYARRFGRWMR